MHTLDWILEKKIVAILRGVEPAAVSRVAEALYEGGISVLEITLNSNNAINQIAQLSEKFNDKMLIGAGTVLDVNDAQAAFDAGAKFLISPGFDAEVVKFAKQHGLVSIPGAYTPTEIMNAHKAGADIVKLFPISNAEYLKNVRAPLNHIRFMPTGGINTNNLHEFHKAGGVAFGIGSALVDKTANADEKYFQHIKEKAKAFAATVASL